MATAKTESVRIEGQGDGWESVLVQELEGREIIGQLFEFSLHLTMDAGREPPTALRTNEEVSLVFCDAGGRELRRVHGMIGSLRQQLGAADRATFEITVVPRMARLALVETQEIFLGATLPDILKSKLERYGFTSADFELRLMGAYPARELVMQYKESDLAFVSRLAEHAGVSIFFEQQADRDRVVFTDHPAGFLPVPGVAGVPFESRSEGAGVYAIERREAMVPSSYVVQDYNYRTPLLAVAGTSDLAVGSGGGVIEYGANVKTPAEAQQLALVRSEERRGRQLAFVCKSGVMALSAGQYVTVTDAPGLAASEKWLISEIRHELVAPQHGEQRGEPGYRNSFRAAPGGFMYRPPQITPRPVIPGVVTGVVQPGPAGQIGGVAQVDADGRYTVMLHLDTADGKPKTSHPMRMAQPFAGPSYGMHFPLRRGTEVLVAFTNGDPDRPIILGAVYNATSPSPVVASNAERHQIRGSTGALFEFVSKT